MLRSIVGVPAAIDENGPAVWSLEPGALEVARFGIGEGVELTVDRNARSGPLWLRRVQDAVKRQAPLFAVYDDGGSERRLVAATVGERARIDRFSEDDARVRTHKEPFLKGTVVIQRP